MTKQYDLQNMTSDELRTLQTEANIQRLNKLEDDVNQLKNEQPIPFNIQRKLTQRRKGKVIEWLGGKDSPAYRKVSRKVFAEMENDYKDRFGIPRYDELPKKYRQDAFNYLARWEPCINTKIEIESLNNQLELIEQGS